MLQPSGTYSHKNTNPNQEMGLRTNKTACFAAFMNPEPGHNFSIMAGATTIIWKEATRQRAVPDLVFGIVIQNPRPTHIAVHATHES